ncbi:MAG: ABC transporter permease [Candidatus Hodarchaeales archaeon]|jgi:ABC-type dipeptide/oligopeptide/nickel transport system permease subunit
MFDKRTQRRKKKLLKTLKSKKSKKASEQSGSQLSIAFRRFRKNKAGLLGLVLSVIIFLIAIFAGPFLDLVYGGNPYGEFEPMSLEYNYIPWYQPPGFQEGSRYLDTFNRILEGNFETSSPFWTLEPGWSRINLTEEGIIGGTGTYAVQSSTLDAKLTQDISSSIKLMFSKLEFSVYLDGENSVQLSVMFGLADGSETSFLVDVSNNNTWSEKLVEFQIINPEYISFMIEDGSSNVVIDFVRLTGGSYYKNLHILGTNKRSHDLFTKLVFGSATSLIVSVGAIIISIIIGLPLGLIAGYFRGRLDEIIMRVTDIFLTLPFYFVMILVIVVLQDTPAVDNLISDLGLSTEVILLSVTFGLGLFGWMGITRLVRATILTVREMDYVEAARSIGASNRRIMILHILPNILAPLIVVITFNLAVNIVAEAGLAFLGFTDESLASWGRELQDGVEVVAVAWWPVLFPAMFIILAVMAFNLFGDGLRDAFDPRLR